MRFLFQHEQSPRLPANFPMQADVPTLQDAELAAAYYGERLGGDLHDFIRVNSRRVLFGLLDMAGRLEQNSTIISAAQHTFRTRSLELFAAEDVNEADAMSELCLELNRSIMAAEGGVRSCPAFAGCYNEDLGTICYFNAGHTPGLLRDGTGITGLEATGLPLGLFSHATCEAPLVALPPGGALLLVSRGLLEGKRRREEFGLEPRGLERRVPRFLHRVVGFLACRDILDGAFVVKQLAILVADRRDGDLFLRSRLRRR